MCPQKCVIRRTYKIKNRIVCVLQKEKKNRLCNATSKSLFLHDSTLSFYILTHA